MNGNYVLKNGKKLRCGITTGACAAAAAKAAAYMLLTGRKVDSIKLMIAERRIQAMIICMELPESFSLRENRDIFDYRENTTCMENREMENTGGETENLWSCELKAEDISVENGTVKCAVRKDGGDDIDVTDGILIYAEVSCEKAEKNEITVSGGEGVGIVSKPGLNQPVGQYAINSAPRAMIRKAVAEAAEELGESGYKFKVSISVPDGAAAAERTFNPVLGIRGGISILGTTGIVEPMSSKALSDSICAEIRVKSHDFKELVLVAGNYGMNFVMERMDIGSERIVKCSNFFGEALDAACESGVRKLLIAGNVGKIIKLAGGIFDTHSRNADARMDIMIRCALRAGADVEVLKQLDSCVTTDAAVKLLRSAGLLQATMDVAAECVMYYVGRRCEAGSAGRMELSLIIFSNDMEILSMRGSLSHSDGNVGSSQGSLRWSAVCEERDDYE